MKYYNYAEAAKILGVQTQYLRVLNSTHKIKGVLKEDGVNKIPESEVHRLLKLNIGKRRKKASPKSSELAGVEDSSASTWRNSLVTGNAAGRGFEDYSLTEIGSVISNGGSGQSRARPTQINRSAQAAPMGLSDLIERLESAVSKISKPEEAEIHFRGAADSLYEEVDAISSQVSQIVSAIKDISRRLESLERRSPSPIRPK